tara:strand:- start:368 stop:577 length:210 start_codon:yes stop_codon:yes gene_type:complete
MRWPKKCYRGVQKVSLVWKLFSDKQGALKKILGKGTDAVKLQEDAVDAPKKIKGQFVKGSPVLWLFRDC